MNVAQRPAGVPKQRFSRKALVVDLDNTLFDWLTFWNRAFGDLVEAVLAHADIDRNRLLHEIQKIHRRVGTSEYAFLLQELRPIIEPAFCEDFDLLAHAAIAAYRNARSTALQIYPTVLDTLDAVRSAGALIVAFTESTGYHTMYRVKRLGLDGIIDTVYSAPDHDIPETVFIDNVRSRSSEHYQFELTEHKFFAREIRKPNPELLLSILASEHVAACDAVYVGDSIVRDIGMAQEAGVLDAYAAYGVPGDRRDLALLSLVTHWTALEVSSQQSSTQEIRPTIVLRENFSELLDHVAFTGA